jgi:hypothetical protein
MTPANTNNAAIPMTCANTNESTVIQLRDSSESTSDVREGESSDSTVDTSSPAADRHALWRGISDLGQSRATAYSRARRPISIRRAGWVKSVTKARPNATASPAGQTKPVWVGAIC